MGPEDTQRIIECPEQQNRDLKVVSSVAPRMCLISLFFRDMPGGVQQVQTYGTAEARTQEVIPSGGFVLVDSDGIRRARLVMEAAIPSLTFFGAEGNVVGQLAVGEQPESARWSSQAELTRLVPLNGLSLYDASGVPRTSVHLRDGLSVFDEKGKREARMSSSGVRL